VVHINKIANILDGHVKTQSGALRAKGEDEEGNLLERTAFML
jgi:hypothetical protein